MKYLGYIIVRGHQFFLGFFDLFLSYWFKTQMKKCGTGVSIKPSSSLYRGLSNLTIGNNVSIPQNATIFCTDAELIIGNNVIFGPSPTIVTGNHRIDLVGKYIIDVHDKLPENDKQVVFQDDIWVGANAMILMGTHIGRGSVIAACSLVNKNVPPYSIVGGTPSKVLKFRFSIEEIIQHEAILYSEDERLSVEALESMRAQYVK